MKLIVDISDEAYELCKRGTTGTFKIDTGMRSGKTFIMSLYKAIANGKLLPNGYGRLGDLDALEKEIVNGIKAGNYEEGYETFAHINNMDDCVDCVRYADTIIEADKVESEK